MESIKFHFIDSENFHLILAATGQLIPAELELQTNLRRKSYDCIRGARKLIHQCVYNWPSDPVAVTRVSGPRACLSRRVGSGLSCNERGSSRRCCNTAAALEGRAAPAAA